MKKGMTPQKQLMLEFRNSEEQFIISDALCAMNNEVQEEMATALVAYLRFGIKRDSFTNPFVQGVFDNLVSYVDFSRSEAEKVATDEFPSPVMYAMAWWYSEHPEETVMFADNSQHKLTDASN